MASGVYIVQGAVSGKFWYYYSVLYLYFSANWCDTGAKSDIEYTRRVNTFHRYGTPLMMW